jgi:hypothetical protein
LRAQAGLGKPVQTAALLNAAICVAVRHRTLPALRQERNTVLSAKAKAMVSRRAYLLVLKPAGRKDTEQEENHQRRKLRELKQPLRASELVN